MEPVARVEKPLHSAITGLSGQVEAAGAVAGPVTDFAGLDRAVAHACAAAHVAAPGTVVPPTGRVPRSPSPCCRKRHCAAGRNAARAAAGRRPGPNSPPRARGSPGHWHGPSAAAALLGVHRNTSQPATTASAPSAATRTTLGRRLALHVACRVLPDLDKSRSSGTPLRAVNWQTTATVPPSRVLGPVGG